MSWRQCSVIMGPYEALSVGMRAPTWQERANSMAVFAQVRSCQKASRIRNLCVFSILIPVQITKRYRYKVLGDRHRSPKSRFCQNVFGLNWQNSGVESNSYFEIKPEKMADQEKAQPETGKDEDKQPEPEPAAGTLLMCGATDFWAPGRTKGGPREGFPSLPVPHRLKSLEVRLSTSLCSLDQASITFTESHFFRITPPTSLHHMNTTYDRATTHVFTTILTYRASRSLSSPLVPHRCTPRQVHPTAACGCGAATKRVNWVWEIPSIAQDQRF
jgi:hypothetical protein